MIVMVIGLLYATLQSQSSPTFVSDCNRKIASATNSSRRNVIFPSKMGYFPSETAYFSLVNAKKCLQFPCYLTDRTHMSSRKTVKGSTFRRILEEKLRDKSDTAVFHERASIDQPGHNASGHAGPVGTVDRLFGLRYFQYPGKNQVYSTARQPRPAVKSQRPTPYQIKVEQLSQEARLALMTLNIEIEHDTDRTISQADIRRAFHRLARRFHPDIATMDVWQAQRESYLLAQEAYDIVCREITRLKGKAA